MLKLIMDFKEFENELKSILLKENIEVFGISPILNEPLLSESYKENLPPSLNYLKKEVWNNPKLLIPWAKSIISVALPYNTTREKSQNFTKSGRVWVSRYAFGEDYHKIFRNKLKSLKNFLIKKNYKARICVDSFPILERSYALRAGLGFIGRNGLLINPYLGSYIFLAEVVTDLEIETPKTQKNVFFEDFCRNCLRCVKACPTKALIGDGKVNPSKCISSYNVEWRGKLPPNSPNLNNNLFGCDICQEVCPFNNKAPLTNEKSFYPKEGLFAPEISELIKKDEKELSEIIKGTPLERSGPLQIKENLRKIVEENQTKRVDTEVSS